MAIKRIVGIDFGTSTSIVKCKRYEDGKPIGDAHHTESVTFGQGVSDPKALTLVRVNEDGTVDCGTDEMIPGATIYRDFKMSLESENEEEQERAKELTYEYMKYLYKRYSHQENDLGEKGDEIQTIISFPAKWKEETRKFMALAVSDAGFKNISSIDEPSAALYAVMARQMNTINDNGFIMRDKDNLILVIDMGAGTTDLAVCKCTVNGESDNVKASDISNDLILSWPEDGGITFGGREIDEKFKDFLLNYLVDCNIPKEISQNFLDQSSGIKSWKEQTVSPSLSKNESVKNCSVVTQLMFFPGVKREPFPEITRESFEELIEDKIEDYKNLVKGCLDKLEENAEIDVVILTGGHSGWYFAKDLVDGTMAGLEHPALKKVQAERNRVFCLTNPQETVALGMVYSKLPFKITKNQINVEVKKEDPFITVQNIDDVPEVAGEKVYNSLSDVAIAFFEENAAEMQRLTSGRLEEVGTAVRVYENADCYMWVDTTPSGSVAQAGMVITDTGIHFGNSPQAARFFKWDIIKDEYVKINFECNAIVFAVPHMNLSARLNLNDAIDAEALYSFLCNLQTALRTCKVEADQSAGQPSGGTAPDTDFYATLQDKARNYLEAHEETGNKLSRGGQPSVRTGMSVHFGEKGYSWVDDTWFANGTKGFIVTDGGFYYRNGWLSEPVRINWYTFRDATQIVADHAASTLNFSFRNIGAYSIFFQSGLLQEAGDFFKGLQQAL